MTEDVKILNSKEAIPARTSPTGVTYAAFREGEAVLWTIWATREDDLGKILPDRNRKQPVEGVFTSEARAYEALRKWLVNQWSKSDAESSRLAAERPGKQSKLDKVAA